MVAVPRRPTHIVAVGGERAPGHRPQCAKLGSSSRSGPVRCRGDRSRRRPADRASRPAAAAAARGVSAGRRRRSGAGRRRRRRRGRAAVRQLPPSTGTPWPTAPVASRSSSSGEWRRGGAVRSAVGPGRGGADHDRGAAAAGRRRRGDGRGHERAARRRAGAPVASARPGAAVRGVGDVRAGETCSPPARSSPRPSPGSRQRQRPPPERSSPRASPCSPRATSWSPTARRLPVQIRELDGCWLRCSPMPGASSTPDAWSPTTRRRWRAVLRDAAATVRCHRHERRRQHGRLRRRQGRARPHRRDAVDADRDQAGQAVRLRHARRHAGVRPRRATRSARWSASSCWPARRCAG